MAQTIDETIRECSKQLMANRNFDASRFIWEQAQHEAFRRAAEVARSQHGPHCEGRKQIEHKQTCEEIGDALEQLQPE